MDTTNITLWSDMAAFPVLTTMTLIPLATMIMVLLSSSFTSALRMGLVGSILTVALSIYLLTIFDVDRPGVQLFEQIGFYSVGVDGVSILFILLTAILTFLSLVYTKNTSRTVDSAHVACLLGYEAILIGAFSTMNAMQFWLLCVLELVPVIFITIRTGTGHNRRWVVTLLLQHWGGGLLMSLAGFLLLAFGIMGTGDTLTFDWLAFIQNDENLVYGNFIFFLLFFGFAVRMPLFPFHGWLPVLVEQGTMASVGIFLVGLNLGVYATIRFILPVMPDVAEHWGWFVIILGLVDIYYGIVLAFAQVNFRRLMAFSVVSHSGMLVIGVFELNRHSLEGSVLLTVAYGLATVGMFFCIGMIYNRVRTVYIPRLGGMLDISQVLAFLFVVCVLSTMAMPGTPGFDGAHLLIEGTIEAYGWFVSIAILIGNVFTAGLLLRAFQQIFISTPKRSKVILAGIQKVRAKYSLISEQIITFVVCSILIGVGFYTSPWVLMIDQNIEQMNMKKFVTKYKGPADRDTQHLNTEDQIDE